ncbi:MAG: cephalosporin hydroxylase family protein [Desulfobacterales bacterium]|jgi:cephalosporin hydroxylase
MNPIEVFFNEVKENTKKMSQDAGLHDLSNIWMREADKYKYEYNFTWLGRPIIQYPQDIIAMQEIIWTVKPDLIIETGVAHGGATVFYASLLELIGGDRKVVGIDIEIRPHNREEIEKHPMSKRIDLVEGSSLDEKIADLIHNIAKSFNKVLVCLDSNHTHDHVLNELRLYSSLVSKGSYLVVFDTVIEDMPSDYFPDRLWGKQNNPKTAVREFLKENDRFEVDKDISNKLLISANPNGFLKCIR